MQTAFEFGDYEVIGEEIHVIDLDCGPVRDDLFPICFSRISDRSSHQAKILSALVATDIEKAFAMIY